MDLRVCSCLNEIISYSTKVKSGFVFHAVTLSGEELSIGFNVDKTLKYK